MARVSIVRWNLKEAGILSGAIGVNAADRWDESYCSYPGRSHRRVETEYEARLKQD